MNKPEIKISLIVVCQFLIGTVILFDYKIIYSRGNRGCQFLIGTVICRRNLKTSRTVNIVSIPYRYCNHGTKGYKYKYTCACQFLIGTVIGYRIYNYEISEVKRDR